uniref:C2H2-type domain-containing protein n=1 Tax=Erythrolobus australicus TaxID=1077150 RepID=A0A7S1TLB1_9RHOD
MALAGEHGAPMALPPIWTLSGYGGGDALFLSSVLAHEGCGACPEDHDGALVRQVLKGEPEHATGDIDLDVESYFRYDEDDLDTASDESVSHLQHFQYPRVAETESSSFPSLMTSRTGTPTKSCGKDLNRGGDASFLLPAVHEREKPGLTVSSTRVSRGKAEHFAIPSMPVVHVKKNTMLAEGALVKKVSECSTAHPQGSSSSEKDKLHQCSLCDSSFSLKYNLNKHIKNVHEHQRPFKCPSCPMTFQQKNHQVKHVATVHENIRPFKCDHCDASFGWVGVLRKHVALIHEKQRPYVCELCDKTFQQKVHLSNHHSAVHLKERPYSCSVCALKFSRREILVRHERRKHSDELRLIPM